MRKFAYGVILGSALFLPQVGLPHCQIPCGIYGDEDRFKALEEDITTVEKSMKQIEELSKQGEKNYNQIVRWVINKDEHAGKIQRAVSEYFMTQRVKPADPKDAEAYRKYVEQLTLLHEMLITAMKAKQTTDLANVEKLRLLLAKFHEAYTGKH